MKSEGVEYVFKLRGDRTPEEVRAGVETMRGEVARAFAALIHNPPGQGVAEAVAEFVRESQRQGAAVRAALAVDFAGVAQSIGHMHAQMAAAVAEITRPEGYFAQVARAAEEGYRALGEWYASLPEEEREELRRLYEDAPLEPVDVNAGGVM